MAAGETVTIALKHPHGIIMQLCRMNEVEEPGLGGTKTVKRAERHGQRVVLKGYSVRGGKVPPVAMEGHFVLTPNVPKDFAVEWFKQNSDLDLVVSGLIKLGSDVKNGDIDGYVRNFEKLKTGMEPIDPDHPPLAGVATYQKDQA